MHIDTLRKLKPAVFLDKDNTLIRDIPYTADPEQIEILPGVIDGLRLLIARGYGLIVITNQSGVARGYYGEEAVHRSKDELARQLFNNGVPLTGFYYCPHHPNGSVQEYSFNCRCRKPSPGMILQAAIDHSLDLNQSWMIGDKPSDVDAGLAAGCHAILLDAAASLSTGQDIVLQNDLFQAAQFILRG